MRKTALGVVLAMMLAAIPVSLFATSAVADSQSDVHIIWIDEAFAPNIIVDNVVIGHQVPTATAFDLQLGTGQHTVVACDNTATRYDGATNTCFNGDTATTGPFAGFPDNVNIGSGGANYTVVLNEILAHGTWTFQNNLNTTGFNRARFQVNNGSLGAIDVCIDSHDGNGLVPFFTNIPAAVPDNDAPPPGASFQDSNELTAVQGAQVYIGSSGGDCSTFQNFTLNFPAGTNTVFTATNSGSSIPVGDQPSCGEACFQVLFVGEDTHTNTPNTEVFCANIVNLAGVQSGLKELVGDVDPTDETTIANTQPSAGDMQAFIESTNAALTLGDATVPPIVAQSWATATAGLRALIHTFQLVGYDLSALPPSAVEQIVLGANGIKLPGVPEDTDVVGAQEALTAFYTSVCVAAPPTTTTTTTTPAPTPVAANAKFTG